MSRSTAIASQADALGYGGPQTAAEWRHRAGVVWNVDRLTSITLAESDPHLREYLAVAPGARLVRVPGVVDRIAFGRPPPDLADVIAAWHVLEGPAATPAADTMLRLTNGAWILCFYSVQDHVGRIASHGMYLSCGFDEATRPIFRGYHTALVLNIHPHAGRHLFGVTAPELIRQRLPADQVWRPWGASLLEQLSNESHQARRLSLCFAALRQALQRRRLAEFDLVTRARHHIAGASGNVSISTVARDLGIGIRTLERVCHDHLGYSPKQYARVRRQWAVAQAALDPAAVKWADLALSLGYSDQAHLSREFVRAHGFSPCRFRDLAGRRGVHLGTHVIMPVDLASPG